MISRAAAFIIWALVAATAVFWLLHLSAQGPTAPQAKLVNSQNLPVRAELSRVLGSTPAVAAPQVAPPELSSRFVLSGVMAPKTAGATGLALIAVDGNPPRPYSLGAHLDENFVLLAVTLRSASIGPVGGAPLLTLELPLLPPPTVGSFAPVSLGAPTQPVELSNRAPFGKTSQ